jgi:branched-chain amino acid aminotransferase
MESQMNITIEEIPASLLGGVSEGQALEFGKVFSDRMFTMHYSPERGWDEATIKQYGNFSLSPATMCLHYGQLIFEGMKAYRRDDGKIGLFRPLDNFRRMSRSAKRLAMPEINEHDALAALTKLLELDASWVPKAEGSALYIRPTMMAVDSRIKLKTSDEYLFFIICSPVGHYYANGMKPTRILVEDSYVRSVRGGVGEAKTAGNYAASLLPSQNAAEQGYDQVLWLDGVHQRYIEEVGSMNIFFKYADKVVTPSLNGSILPGITRDSVITLARDQGTLVVEEAVDLEKILADIESGAVKEVFGTGTAVVISSVGSLRYKGKDYIVNDNNIGDYTLAIYKDLTDVQYGRVKDPYGWTVSIG